MYEIFRNDLIAKLQGILTMEQMMQAMNAIDTVAINYSFSKQTTDLAIVGRKELLDTIKLYFIIKSQQGMSDSSVKTESYVLHKFAMQCTLPMHEITSNVIRSYLYNYKTISGVSQRTLQTYRCIICTFFKWCHAEGYIPCDITSVIKKFSYQTKPRKALTQIKLQDVRSVCQSSFEHALIQTLYSTGCRISEITNVRMSDIDWARKQITVTGKGNKTRVVYINAKAEKAIRTYLEDRGHPECEWLFMNRRKTNKLTKECAQRVFRNIRDKLSLGKGEFVPHTMRHTMATQAATVCPIQQVQQMLGHVSINTTMIYAETNKDQVKAGHKLAVI